MASGSDIKKIYHLFKCALYKNYIMHVLTEFIFNINEYTTHTCKLLTLNYFLTTGIYL